MRFPSGNAGVPESRGSKSGNNGGGPGPTTPPAKPADPELAVLVAAWPDLPPAIRAGIVAMVAAAMPPPPRPLHGRQRPPRPRAALPADTGGLGFPACIRPAGEAVQAVHRPPDTRRQGPIAPERDETR
ncbi:MAG: hypothetical protein ACK5VC_06635 [bacterium]